MLKSILIPFVFCIAFTLNAQETEQIETEYPQQGEYEIGVIAGIFSGYVSEDGFSPVEDSDYLHRFGLGVHFDYYFSKTWSLKTRVNYDPKGGKDKATNTAINLNYLSIPVMANWHFGKRKRWYLHFGPYAAFLLSADIEGIDAKDIFNSSQIGFDLGIGVKIPIGNTLFFIESDGQNDFSSPVIDMGEDDSKLGRSSLSIGIIF